MADSSKAYSTVSGVAPHYVEFNPMGVMAAIRDYRSGDWVNYGGIFYRPVVSGDQFVRNEYNRELNLVEARPVVASERPDLMVNYSGLNGGCSRNGATSGVSWAHVQNFAFCSGVGPQTVVFYCS